MFLSKNKNLNSQGITLVLSLLILSLAAMSVMLVTGLIAMQVRSSLNSVNSVVAYYVGESGIEQSLYYLQYSRDHSDFTNNFDKLESAGFNLINLANGGQYSIAVASTSVVTAWDIYNLSTSSPQHLDIIDPSGEVTGIEGPVSPEYSIAWEIDNCFADYKSGSRLETTVYSFKANFTEPQTRTMLDICGCTFLYASCFDAGYAILDSDRYYRFSFRPLDDNVKKLTFRLSSGIKSQAAIKIDGIYHGSRYRVSAQLPALSPSSDIFSYVIFSEEDLTKGL